jgi:peptidoglycan/xylan/chitin deacetylase (PgdA/CDA1 family)
VVYLTFDDGPSPTGTQAMIGVLQRHHAKATFFVIGKTVAAYPGLVREEIAAGESVGGHTWTHPHLRTLSRAAIAAQLTSTRDLIRTLGAPARCFRPPFGETNSIVRSVARSLHVHQYLWTTESKDWTGAPASVDLAKALAGLQPGAIIVFHDWVPQTQQVVDQFLTIAERRGYVAAALPC